jgi:hypothetical protein
MIHVCLCVFVCVYVCVCVCVYEGDLDAHTTNHVIFGEAVPVVDRQHQFFPLLRRKFSKFSALAYSLYKPIVYGLLGIFTSSLTLKTKSSCHSGW